MASMIVSFPASERCLASASNNSLHSFVGHSLSHYQRYFNPSNLPKNGRKYSNKFVTVNPYVWQQKSRKAKRKYSIDKPRCSVALTSEGQFTLPTTPAVQIAERRLLVGGKSVLSGVPDNVVLNSAPKGSEGVFLGASFPDSNSRHVVPLGTLKDVRFLSCFRFKIWWIAPKMGSSGKEIPVETQFLLLETPVAQKVEVRSSYQTVYTVFLPLLDGSFRACLQGNEKDQLELCLESGDPTVTSSSSSHALFIYAGTDPFKVITDAVSQAVELHLQTFCHRDEKKMPGILDWFGWCTWDAFYTDVSAKVVEEGLKCLSGGGTPPRFVIIDDGWQCVEKPAGASQKELLARLIHIKENQKFQQNGEEGGRPEHSALGIQHTVQIAKEKYHLKYVYVWHALTGYWGGVEPGAAEMVPYHATLQYPAPPPAELAHMPEIDSLAIQGLGLVDPKRAFKFFSDLHSYLAAAGVDGVKVDVQGVLETVGAGFGGRVSLASQYHRALEASVAQNFPDNGCIACMSHSTDCLYFSKQTAVIRASDDFYTRDPVSHTIHIASVAYNSIFLGEFMQPDWDMFHSLHPAAEYHAAARAIGGCPVYVSDEPGKHNFDLLKKLVLPDGSVLRARLPGRPTCDCLFVDPSRDRKSLLKIWNMNLYTGVLGVFNCQGAAWSQVDRKNVLHDANPKMISGSIRPRDVHLLADAAVDDWTGNCAIYSHRGELVCLPKSADLPVTLKVLEYELYTITPIKNLGPYVSFAPLGLIDMFNAGGAIKALEYKVFDQDDEAETSKAAWVFGMAANPSENVRQVPTATVKMAIHGCGRLGAYSSVKPRKCLVQSSNTDFSYDSASGLVTLTLQEPVEGQLWNVTVEL